MSQQQIQTLAIVGVIIVLLAFRIWRSTREQRWALGSLWALPIVFILLTGLVVTGDTISGSPLAPLAAALGLGIGVGIGLYQGNHTALRIDKPGKVVFVKQKPIGIAIFMGVLALRIAIRWVVGGAPGQTPVGPNGVPIVTPAEAIIGSGLLALAVGTIVGLRWYVKQAYDAAPSVASPPAARSN
jgi:Protein of unknown function (DUF1453)